MAMQIRMPDHHAPRLTLSADAVWEQASAEIRDRSDGSKAHRGVVVFDVELPVVMDVVPSSLPTLADGQLPHRLCQVDLFLHRQRVL